MDKKTRNPKELRRSNKAQILWHLYNKGPLSRLELASLCHLTTPSITQLMQDLLVQGEVIEIGSVQRNATGRREVLVDLNPGVNIALGINIEKEITYFCVANVKEVFKIYEAKTQDFDFYGSLDKFDAKINEIIGEYPDVNQICIGVTGKVEDGAILNGYEEVPSFNLKKHIEDTFNIRCLVINNLKAQALSLYKQGNENFVYVTHSPSIGSAMVIKGEVINQNDKATGDVGHLIIDVDGSRCSCGKNGCLNTIVSDYAIEQAYLKKTGKALSVDEIYKLYETDEAATEILDFVITKTAIVIADVNEFLNPERIFLVGGIFCNDRIYEKGWEILNKCNFDIEVERIVNAETLKATAEAKYIICKSILEV